MDRHQSLKASSVLFALLALLAIAWSAGDPPKNQAAKKPAAPSKAPPAAEVAAVVNGERIMLSELIARLDELGIPPEQRENVGADVLNGLIDNALLIQFLTAQKIPYDNKTVDAHIAQLRTEIEKDGGKFSESIARLGMTEQKIRATMIAEVQWQNYLKGRVSEKELADYLAKYREHFDGSEVRASHILVEVPANADMTTRTAAKAKIEKIRKELSGGMDFAAAAQKYSDCPSKEQGGDVDWFPRRGKMVEPFAKNAFSLKKGETSGIVESQFGYHLIRVTDRRSGKPATLSDPNIRNDVTEALSEQLKDSVIAQQRKTAKIEIAPGVESPELPKTKTAAQPTPNKVKK